MSHKAAKDIRNVTLIGHRRSGKTSLNEALLFESNTINRFGNIADGSTASDTEEDEKTREMSIQASLSSFEWKDTKINLMDTPGDPSFVADVLGSLQVCDSAILVVNAVMGVEVNTERLWQKCDELGLPRLIFINMLDRERADFYRALESLRQSFGNAVVPTEIPIGSEHEISGVVDLIDMKGFEYKVGERSNATPVDIPDDLREKAEKYREQLMDSVAENDDDLMERYLEDEEISHEEIVEALNKGVTEGSIFPVVCGVATMNLGSDRMLDSIVEDLPSPEHRGATTVEDENGEPVEISPDADEDLVAYVFKTRADPFAGRLNMFRIYSGTMHSDSHVTNVSEQAKERVGQLLVLQGKEIEHATEFGPGDIGALPRLKQTKAGDVLSTSSRVLKFPKVDLPAPVMAFAIEPKAKGDEEKAFTALRRFTEEDPTLDVHRDPQTGEQILAGLSQMHVEVIVDRMKRRFGAEVSLKPPRVPYKETITTASKAQGRYKKQTGGRGQFGDCFIEIEPLEDGEEFEFVNAIKGGVIPTSYIPAVEKGIIEAMEHGDVAGYPVKGVRIRLYDGSHHAVDSSEMAFKIAGSMAFKNAMSEASPVLLEPIMTVTAVVPDDSVGDVIGDISGRRGKPLGMEPKGSSTEIKAEVPMAEMLQYAPDLRSITAGRGDFTMELARYESVPSHLSEKILASANKDEEQAEE